MNVWLEAPVQERNVPLKLAGTTAATGQKPTLMHRHDKHTVVQMTWLGLSISNQSSGGLYSAFIGKERAKCHADSAGAYSALTYPGALLQVQAEPVTQEGETAVGAAQLEEALLRQICAHRLRPLNVHVCSAVPARTQYHFMSSA